MASSVVCALFCFCFCYQQLCNVKLQHYNTAFAFCWPLLPIPPIPTTELPHEDISKNLSKKNMFQKNKNRFSVMQHFKNYICISLLQ
ncbi:hypothetical protein Sjap_007875 [Stephania japonica]|uniref:Secreted protein n=1 Tax=Stephania japonica TaxID=461633 RepID=A0AAP0JPC3_9MAGN